jgi:predicted TIM-barrel fold metal-dependent hydrolase
MKTAFPTRFEGLLDLARLPYFEVKDGELVLADSKFGPAIDVHTHLSLTFLIKQRVDLRLETEKVAHYLPEGRPIDFEVYQNRNLSDDDRAALEHDLGLNSLRTEGMRKTHTIPNLLREMRRVGVRASVLLPIEWPVLSRNAETWLDASRGSEADDKREGVVCFGSVHPFDRHMEQRLDAQKAMGARGVKIHPAVQLVRPDHDRAMRVYRACGARDLPVLIHCGPVDIEGALGRKLSQLRNYERAVAECPETTFFLGHAGAMQMEEALRLAKRYPNVVLEMSGQSLPNVRRILDEAPPDRVVYGSDWPFYHQAIGIAKVLMATEGDEAARARVLHDNAARILRLPPLPSSSSSAQPSA